MRADVEPFFTSQRKLCGTSSNCASHRRSGLIERCRVTNAMLTRSATSTRACSNSSPISRTAP
eukprot:1828612-Prymnesium_polylepis.2